MRVYLLLYLGLSSDSRYLGSHLHQYESCIPQLINALRTRKMMYYAMYANQEDEALEVLVATVHSGMGQDSPSHALNLVQVTTTTKLN
jgi:hypothetical protein